MKPIVTEAQFQAQFIELARMLGYRIAHFRAARTKSGWRTPCSGDGAGFPDNLLCKPGRTMAVELKAEAGRLTPAQKQWLEELAAGGIETYTFKPSDWERMVAILQGKKEANNEAE